MNLVLENYVAVANMIADTFGDHCEVILHDFSIPQNSVVYTRNNVVTNRQVGQSFTEYFVKGSHKEGWIRMCDSQGEFKGIYQWDEAKNRYQPQKMFL